jgi:rRNA processing protein Gar1
MIVCKATVEDVPKFNRAVFFENKAQVGNIDEILGPINKYV